MAVEADLVNVWLDCDPGHDDAFAILFAAIHPKLNLLGISTVHGNASIDHTTYNASSLLTAMGRSSIPVYKGAGKGLVRPAVHADAIHGESGLDGTSLLPTPKIPFINKPAIEAMATALLASPPNSAWLVATGALTNVAEVFVAYPQLASHIKGLSLMGGAVGGGFTDALLGTIDDRERIGNWSTWAEFNILVDPEAANYLFTNKVLIPKTVLIPLDVTHLVLASPDIQDLLLYGKEGKREAEGKSTLRIMLWELLNFFAKTYTEVFGFTEGPPLHDPLAVAVILDGITGWEIPFYDFHEQGAKERYEVQVVTEGTHEDAKNGAQTGRTIAKLLPPGVEGIKIPRNLDVRRFWTILEDCLELADKENSANGIL